MQLGAIANEFIEYYKPTKNDLVITTFSNYGSAVDFVTPGESIITLYPTNLGGNIVIGAGTSQATAYMTSAISNILSYNNNFTNEQVYEILEYYSEDLGDEGKDVYYGNGFVNFNNMQECTCGSENCYEIYCFGCTSSECIYHETSEKVLESIELTTTGVKTEYTEGEKFDTTGLIVTAKYSDGSSAEVTDYTYSPEGELTTSNTKIVVTYTENEITKTAEIAITVKAKQVVEKVLESIELTINGVKTEYTEGEKIDITGLVVTAVYSDGSSKVITNYSSFPVTELTTENNKITISYTEDGITKTAYIEITVKAKQVTPEKTLNNIELITNAVRTEYTEGEKFDTTGLIVTAKYSDGSSGVVTDYTYSPEGELTPSDTKVTITYKDKTEEIGITVKAKQAVSEKTLQSIELITNAVRTEYTEGEKFDKTGLIVTAKYSDGSSGVVTDYTYSPEGELTPSDTKVTITYKDKTEKIGITVKAKQVIPEKTLQSIAVTTKPNKTEYTEGEKFSKTGMVVTAKYSDGTSAQVTDYTYSPTGELTTNNDRITVSYVENGITKTTYINITVNAKQTENQGSNNNNNQTNNQNNSQNNGQTNNSSSGNTNNNNTNNSGTIQNIIVEKDNTIKDGNIANTGVEEIIIPIAIISIIVVVAVIGNIKYKDI